jgi:RNA methyltransferase, TrmH family
MKTTAKTITSRHNPLIKRMREAIREHKEEIVIEGPKPVADAIANGWKAIAVLEREANISAEAFDSITETKNPQHVIGLFERPHASAADILGRRDTIAVALDAVQDPGNVGTIIRLAAAFDASGVLLLPGCADAFGPKAIRSSVGAILSVPIARITPQELFDANVPLVATAMDGERSDPPAKNGVIIFGNEGAGVSAEVQRHATKLAVAMSQRVDSLNVAATAAILLARSFALRS